MLMAMGRKSGDVLAYASPPVGVRAEVGFEADGVVIRVPTKVSTRFIGGLCVMGGLAPALIWIGILAEGSGALRGVLLIAGAFMVNGVLERISVMRSWATLTVRGEELIVSQPRFAGIRVQSFTLSKYKDVVMDWKESVGSLVLVGEGERGLLLEARHYREADLGLAMRVLREVMGRGGLALGGMR